MMRNIVSQGNTQ